jgi:hypothetical protein
MQDGAKTLARIWEAAWRAGNGESQPQGSAFDQGKLQKLYNTPSFLPAFKLQDVTLDAAGRIVPANGAADHEAPPALATSNPSARRPRRPAAGKAVRRKVAAKRKRARG